MAGGELFDRIVSKTFYTEKEARDLVKILLSSLQCVPSPPPAAPATAPATAPAPAAARRVGPFAAEREHGTPAPHRAAPARAPARSAVDRRARRTRGRVGGLSRSASRPRRGVLGLGPFGPFSSPLAHGRVRGAEALSSSSSSPHSRRCRLWACGAARVRWGGTGAWARRWDRRRTARDVGRRRR